MFVWFDLYEYDICRDMYLDIPIYYLGFLLTFYST